MADDDDIEHGGCSRIWARDGELGRLSEARANDIVGIDKRIADGGDVRTTTEADKKRRETKELRPEAAAPKVSSETRNGQFEQAMTSLPRTTLDFQWIAENYTARPN
jgi:hypothetical protein